jgi:hypothetical protein
MMNFVEASGNWEYDVCDDCVQLVEEFIINYRSLDGQ